MANVAQDFENTFVIWTATQPCVGILYVCSLNAGPDSQKTETAEKSRRKRSAVPFLQRKGELDGADTRFEIEDNGVHPELDANHGLIELGARLSVLVTYSEQREYELEGHTPMFELPETIDHAPPI